MPPPLRVSVPADDRYRAVGPEMVGKYAELAGCGTAEAATVLADVTKAADDLAKAGTDIAIACDAGGAELHVTLTAGSRSTVVRHAIPAAK
jgi:hypothetical protein